MSLRPDQNQALAQHFNKMHPETFKRYINNPKTGRKLKAWMQANNYQHPGMMQSNNVSPVVSPTVSTPVTSNLGMSGPSMQNAYPTAPDTGFKIPLTHTPTNREVMPPTSPFVSKYYDPASSPSSFMSGQGVNAKSALPASSRAVGTSGSFTSGAGEVFGSQASEQAVAESIAKSGTESAGASGLTGPQAFFANMALEAIPTRDRNKVNTPFGDEGSVPGILKGAGKGALLGATIGSAVPVVGTGAGAIAGGVIGGLAGTQGTFDSTSPRQVIGASVRRPRGGLLQVPKGLYG